MPLLRPIIFYFSLLTAGLAQSQSIKYIDCNQALESRSTYTALDNERNTLLAWNHINDSKEFNSLKLESEWYEIDRRTYQVEPECGDTKVQNAILVLKLNDWTRQHSNGIEAIIDSKSLRFEHISHVLIDLRLNTKNTSTPSKELLRERYGKLLDQSQLNQLDNGKAYLGLTLFEEDALDQSSKPLNLEYFLEIDQAVHSDQWLRILIPITDFIAFTEKDYSRRSVNLNDFKHTKIKGFRITAENSQGLQVRNLLKDQWNGNLPETFSELSVSFRRIEFLSLISELLSDQ